MDLQQTLLCAQTQNSPSCHEATQHMKFATSNAKGKEKNQSPFSFLRACFIMFKMMFHGGTVPGVKHYTWMAD